ncbi:hypothetical protein CK203_074331 [Vitis vinifera]|uniref:Retrotransposon gag domain-containing protein n=1 Tax=Vitis vinifera TaxID=29760 RepID=A0A438BYM1_VITVI|nr:hypothetical protein CK203_074331 [Vitis vinifera]
MANKTIGGNCVDRQGLEVSTLAPSVRKFCFHLIQSLAKMATPPKAIHPIGKGIDDCEWRKTIERRQLASERQLKALLQEIERLKEKKRCITYPGFDIRPPRRQRSRGQATRAWEIKSPVATTWAPRPDPMVAPMVQNVHPHHDPMVTPAMRNAHSHLAEQPTGRSLPNEPPIGSISKGWMNMLSTPFCSHIINYEPPKGFLVPKFSTYDGTNDPFDHIMHYRQLMTLDIGNDALLCKDLSEAFVGQYLCSARHKQNISTLPNIKMQDNESLREFVKRFGQAILQVEACSMDAVLQIFK